MNQDWTKPGNWALRRGFMFSVSAFCMAVIAYILWTGLDTEPAETAVSMAFVVLLGNVGSYVFGACWDDKNRYGQKDS
jgi:hypothetical protein